MPSIHSSSDEANTEDEPADLPAAFPSPSEQQRDELQPAPDLSLLNKKNFLRPSALQPAAEPPTQDNRKYLSNYFVLDGEKYELLINEAQRPTSAPPPRLKSVVHIPEGSTHFKQERAHFSTEKQSEVDYCQTKLSQLSISHGDRFKEVGGKCKQKLKHLTPPILERECGPERDSSPVYFSSHSQCPSRASSSSPERRRKKYSRAHKAGKGEGGHKRHDDYAAGRRKLNHSPDDTEKRARAPPTRQMKPKRGKGSKVRRPIAELSKSFWPCLGPPENAEPPRNKIKGKKHSRRSPSSASSSSSSTSSTDSDSDRRSYSRHRRRHKRRASHHHRRAGSSSDSTSSSRDRHRSRRHRRSRSRSKAPALPTRFDGNAEALAPYLSQLLDHFDDYWRNYRSDTARISAITRSLDGKASQWAVGLHESRSSLLYNFKDFVTALKNRFEDAQLRRQGRNKLRTIRQGNRSVRDYNDEFLSLLRFVPEWSPAAILDTYKDGLSPQLLTLCRAERPGPDVLQWTKVAADLELDLGREARPHQSRFSAFQRTSDIPPRTRSTRPSHTDNKPVTCYHCGKLGHYANVCKSKLNQQRSKFPASEARTEHPKQEGKPKPSKPRPKDSTLGLYDDSNASGSDCNNLHSDQMLSVNSPSSTASTVPLDLPRGELACLYLNLKIPGTGRNCRVNALLDSGCSRSVISEDVVHVLKPKLFPLTDYVAFSQFDGSLAGGQPAVSATEPLQLKAGCHTELISFIVAPGMQNQLILGIPWLQKWNPHIDWSKNELRFPSQLDSEKSISLSSKKHTRPDTLLATIDSSLVDEKIPPAYKDLHRVFSEQEADKLPPHRSTDCAIDFIPGATLPKPRMYPMSQTELADLRQFIDTNLKRGFIEPARPKVAAPVMFREKKDGTKRLVVDYRNLNTISASNLYPMPLLRDLLSHLSKGRIFTKLDLREAYYRIRIQAGDEWKTAFNCPLGCFQFKVLPFGLQGAPAVFMQRINEVLHEFLFKGVLVYLDDILIYTDTLQEHVTLVRAVLKKLLEAKLYAKLSKCEFHQDSVDFLGYRISSQGIEMDPNKVRAVVEWEPPRTRRQLQSFLGFANFYRQFIPSFAQIALPITNLLKLKDPSKSPKPSQPLKWTMECDAAFNKLKRLFSAEPILKHPDFNAPFVVQADASDVAVGAVLLQKDLDGVLHPCAYTSRKLTATEQRWAIWEKEAFAVHWALSTWRHFLEGAALPFEVWTDHKNLQALTSPKKLTPKQARWAQYFARFKFTLRYLPGGDNFMADALSRLPQYNSHVASVVESVFPPVNLPPILAVTTRAQAKRHPHLTSTLADQIIAALPQDEWYRAHPNLCSTQANLPYHGEKLYIPSTVRLSVLQHVHDSKQAGHFGFVKTFHLTKRQFWWPSLKKDVEAYIKSCTVCAAAKRPPGKPTGLLQQVARPTAPWSEISMDFIGELPDSHGHTFIWVITDLFSKQVHFVPLTKLPSAKTLAKLFIQHVYRLHGVPKRIISDRGTQFTSQFWTEFLQLIGSSPALTSSHHPQSNGGCERANSVLEQYLRCYLNYQQDNWSDLLPFAEVAYNNSVHSSTGFAPFKVVYGQDFVPIPELPIASPTSPTLQDWISSLQANWPVVHSALADAHAEHKKFADMKRQPTHPYKVGDLVYLSTKYLQSTQQSKKLGPKFVGPFPISAIVNPVTLKLQLPKMWSRVHPVFHVSLIKPAFTSTLRPLPAPAPPPVLMDGGQHFEVKEIIDSRKIRNKLQYLVVWKHFPPSTAEWVKAEDVVAPNLVAAFRKKYPAKP